MTKDRLFFAAKVKAAWPEPLPQARLIAEEFRHMTLAFLGPVNREALMREMNGLPLPTWTLSPSGNFEEWMLLPKKTPHVVAANPVFIGGKEPFLSYQRELSQWLFHQKFLRSLDSHFLPHVSVARDSFDAESWSHFPCQIPFFIRAVALLKSLGHSSYETLWQQESVAPFEEIEHTADLAYLIRGKDFSELAFHAALALAFSFPAFSPYLKIIPPCNSIDEIVSFLNRWIAEIDMREGIGLKAVSYHANLEKKDFLQWTMIVDV